MKWYSPYQFSTFRILLGIYLCIHFFDLIPYAAEIWSNAGLLSDPKLNFTYGVIPNLLYVITDPTGVTLFVGVLLILSILFLIGFQRRIVALLLWYGWVCLFDRNNLINNPGIPYLGWILLACTAIPNGEPLSLTKLKEGKTWEFPEILFWGAWGIMAIGYTISGIDKFMAPSWKDGTAVMHLLVNPLARNWWLREFLMSMPDLFIKLNTWAVLSLEVLFLPLAIFNLTRKWVWLAIIFMHLGILMVVDFADLTIGMLFIHWFTFDSRWLKPQPEKSGIVFFDGVCGICNTLVDFLMSEDRNHVLQFAPLQGTTAEEKLSEADRTDLDTLVYIEGAKTYYRSDAILKLLGSMGGFWKVFVVFKLVPRFIRNAVYKLIANNRLKWFGQKDACRMPTKEEIEKILL